MIYGTIRLLPSRTGVLGYFHNSLFQSLALNSLQSLPNSFFDRRAHAFAGEPRQLLSQAVGLFIFDIQTHGRILPYLSSILPTLERVTVSPAIDTIQATSVTSTTHLGAAPILRSTKGRKFQQVRCW